MSGPWFYIVQIASSRAWGVVTCEIYQQPLSGLHCRLKVPAWFPVRHRLAVVCTPKTKGCLPLPMTQGRFPHTNIRVSHSLEVVWFTAHSSVFNGSQKRNLPVAGTMEEQQPSSFLILDRKDTLQKLLVRSTNLLELVLHVLWVPESNSQNFHTLPRWRERRVALPHNSRGIQLTSSGRQSFPS